LLTALEALGVKIYGNGREWQMDVSLPDADLLPLSSLGCGQKTHISFYLKG
jgi:hypothetical protein